jgi:hypothetical protein
MHRHRWLVAVLASAAAVVGLASCSSPSSSSPSISSSTGNVQPDYRSAHVPNATVQGPIEPSSKISLIGSTLFPLSELGYEQSEFFLSGTAASYTSATPLQKNGRWHVTPATTAPYKTRIVVYRPIDPRRFDGTVFVEWMNVTAGTDAPAAWLNDHLQMIRDGMAYVGVDAQAGGINGEAGSIATGLGQGVGSIKKADPARYGSLVHPGDSFSYSIFQQTGEAVHASATKILSGLHPRHVIAVGESQSAIRMVTYIDALQPQSAGIYDGYMVYSRFGNGANLSEPPQKNIAAPTPTYIRTDLHVPVMLFETETDLVGLGYVAARQPPTDEIREWETAGTAHDDTYGVLYSRSDNGSGVADTTAFRSMLDPPKDPVPGIVDCGAPINAGAQTYVLRAAMLALSRWVDGGEPPPQSPRLDVDSAHAGYVTDANGNAMGGIRPPQVQVPVAKLSGIGQPHSMPAPGTQPGNVKSISSGTLCEILGTTVPFSAAKLSSLYPSHAAFVRKWDAATAADVRLGYLLPVDARTLDRVAARSHVGG